MAHNSDYSHIWAEPNNGLSVDEIGKALGSASRDVGTLCTQTNINKWAKSKPQAMIPYPNYRGKLTDTMRAEDSFGFDLTRLFISQSDPINLFNRTSYEWPYRDRVAPYRMLDFDGYKTGATVPFSADPGRTLTQAGIIPIAARYSADADIDLSKLGIMNRGEEQWFLAFIYRHGTSSTVNIQFATTVEDFVSSGRDAFARINLTNGNNDGIWVFTNATGATSLERFKYIALPNGFRRYRVDTSPVTGYVNITLFGSVSPIYDQGGDLSAVDMDYEVSNNSAYSSSAEMTLEFAYGTSDVDLDPTLISPISDSYSLNPNALESHTVQLNSEQWGSDTIIFNNIWIRGYFDSITREHGTTKFQMDFTNRRSIIGTTHLAWVRLSSLV